MATNNIPQEVNSTANLVLQVASLGPRFASALYDFQVLAEKEKQIGQIPDMAGQLDALRDFVNGMEAAMEKIKMVCMIQDFENLFITKNENQ